MDNKNEVVEVVLKMPRELIEYIKSEKYDERLDRRFDYMVRFAMKNSKELPKGHDNLVDKTILLKNARLKAQEYDEPWKTNLASVVEYLVCCSDIALGEDYTSDKIWTDKDKNFMEEQDNQTEERDEY